MGMCGGNVWLYTTFMSSWKRKTRIQDLVKVPILVQPFLVFESWKYHFLHFLKNAINPFIYKNTKFLLKLVLSPNLEFVFFFSMNSWKWGITAHTINTYPIKWPSSRGIMPSMLVFSCHHATNDYLLASSCLQCSSTNTAHTIHKYPFKWPSIWTRFTKLYINIT
jgi:hypothetical protein